VRNGFAAVRSWLLALGLVETQHAASLQVKNHQIPGVLGGFHLAVSAAARAVLHSAHGQISRK
jgi:hypothetical protein